MRTCSRTPAHRLTHAVLLALLQAGDKILGLDLSMGGHLTHGSPVNFSGKLYQPVFYGVKKEDGLVDYDMMEKVAKEEKPKVIICGASAYSRDWDYARIRKIADGINAFVMCDMAHPAGLIAKGLAQFTIRPLSHCYVYDTQNIAWSEGWHNYDEERL